ncbi:Acetyltransferase (isoleucine patch superfamily) [hydrothermal vent metagenome]|uniref:Acetyltransferase (Isoleucine patch superfamily) n=1 Tax=hydrothermal vent metagenome TaxID=652676 RepID=A0A3B0SAR0_9ZZZZ
MQLCFCFATDSRLCWCQPKEPEQNVRRDTRPKWLFDLMIRFRDGWAKRFVFPHFDAIGPDAKFIGPRHIQVFGAGITAGRALHVIASKDAPVRLTVWAAAGKSGQIKLGDCVLITGGVRLLASQRITVGDGCMFAAGAVISDCDWHGIYDRTEIDQDAKPVTLADNVWIGTNAFVGKGVNIGKNSIVGAGAIVTKDVPANVVVAGNPAKIVKKLDPDGPFRTRMDMLDDPAALERFMDAAYAKMLAGNSLLDWLRAQVSPTRKD